MKYGVLCVQPSGHRGVVQRLCFATESEAERAATKRNRHPNAIALQFQHFAVPVEWNDSTYRYEVVS